MDASPQNHGPTAPDMSFPALMARQHIREMKENRRLIRRYRAMNLSNREIAIALGIPEDSPQLE